MLYGPGILDKYDLKVKKLDLHGVNEYVSRIPKNVCINPRKSDTESTRQAVQPIRLNLRLMSCAAYM